MIVSYERTFHDLSQFIYNGTSIESVNPAVCRVNRKATNSRIVIEESHEIVLSARILMKFRGKRLEKGRDSGTPNDLRVESRECEARCV